MKATATTKEVEITITMNETQASHLKQVCMLIGGCEKKSARKTFTELLDALNSVKVAQSHCRVDDRMGGGTIYFISDE